MPQGSAGFDAMGSLRRTHACGEVTAALVGSEVVLGGWVQGRRDHGGVIFVDLRERRRHRAGRLPPGRLSASVTQRAGELRSEFVILVRGRVERRSPETVNPKLPTRRGRGRGERAAPAQHRDAAALRDRRGDAGRRVDAPAPPHPRSAAPAAAARAAAAPRALPVGAPHAHASRASSRSRRRSSAKATPEGARDFLVPSRLQPGELLRAAAVAADHEAAADGRGLRPLLPDRPLLPRRGPARRPPARVHAGRPRDVVRRRRGRAARCSRS